MTVIQVLLIDRQEAMRERLRAALEGDLGIAVVGEAADAAAAALLVCKMQPHVVVIGLADSSGTDLLSYIRGFQRSIRVVVVALQSDPGHILRVLQAGAHGVLLRQVAGRALVDAVRAVHAGGIFISGGASAALLQDYVKPRSDTTMNSVLSRLSWRERQVLDMVVSGMTSKEIARQLAISPKSVDTYRSRLMSKIGVSNVLALMDFALENGLTRDSVA